jgi:hypothetical protein
MFSEVFSNTGRRGRKLGGRNSAAGRRGGIAKQGCGKERRERRKGSFRFFCAGCCWTEWTPLCKNKTVQHKKGRLHNGTNWSNAAAVAQVARPRLERRVVGAKEYSQGRWRLQRTPTDRCASANRRGPASDVVYMWVSVIRDVCRILRSLISARGRRNLGRRRRRRHHCWGENFPPLIFAGHARV